MRRACHSCLSLRWLGSTITGYRSVNVLVQIKKLKNHLFFCAVVVGKAGRYARASRYHARASCRWCGVCLCTAVSLLHARYTGVILLVYDEDMKLVSLWRTCEYIMANIARRGGICAGSNLKKSGTNTPIRCCENLVEKLRVYGVSSTIRYEHTSTRTLQQ